MACSFKQPLSQDWIWMAENHLKTEINFANFEIDQYENIFLYLHSKCISFRKYVNVKQREKDVTADFVN